MKRKIQDPRSVRSTPVNRSRSQARFARPLGAAGLLLPSLITAQAQPAATNAPAASIGAPAADQTLTTTASLSVKEVYDSNLLMQSQGPLANRDTFGTMVTPSFGLKWRPCLAFWLDATYTPEMTSYYSDHTEDYVSHKAALNLGGVIGSAKWENDNSINWVQGDSKGATFYWAGPTAPGVTPVPALGGTPLRDRADQVVYRDSFKFEQPIGDWFARPVATAFVQDFMTQNRTVTHVAGTTSYYEDYVDRADFNFGFDAGYHIQPATALFLGYRFGFEEQSQVANTAAFPSYSNDYQRVLAGIESSPVKWLKFNAVIGPDFRSFYGAYIPASFEKHRTKIYFDGSASVLPTDNDIINLATKRYELPGYLGKSVLDDTTFDLTWRHKFTPKFSAGIGLRLENWDFDAPARNEWWYGGNVFAAYAFTPHLSAETTYGYDRVLNGISGDPLGTANWQAQRHTVSLGVKYKF